MTCFQTMEYVQVVFACGQSQCPFEHDLLSDVRLVLRVTFRKSRLNDPSSMTCFQTFADRILMEERSCVSMPLRA